MVALFSRAVIQRTGPYREALEKPLEPPKVSPFQHHNHEANHSNPKGNQGQGKYKASQSLG
jgi:hypothetical protein